MTVQRSSRPGGWRFLLGGFAVSAILLGASTTAWAVDPAFSQENTCVEGDETSRACINDTECDGFAFAKTCVQGRCEILCESEAGDGTVNANLESCSLGERCVAKSGAGGQRYICEPQPFRMDLNLLDLCIKHYLDKTSPVFTANECSLERNMNLLLDQNGDKRFDLFDVDLCVLAFLEQRGCQRDATTDLYQPVDSHIDASECCESDDDCGFGTYCDPDLNICQRDCGLVASREVSVEPFERQCMRALTTCDYGRGRCNTVDVTELTCQVDRDCLTGSYCLLGTCTPNCYRAVDCPDSGWYCAKNNQCRAVPPPEADEGFSFEPQNYTVRFARDLLRLSDVQDFDSSQLAIMDLISNRQIIGNASVGFGYRMEINYGLKSDASCLKAFVDCTANPPDGETEMECWARQNDCIIDPSEEWIRPGAPFGRINAAEIPVVSLALEPSIADGLSPGTYPATVRLIFDNGASDTIHVTYTKKSPSGEYLGDLTVYQGLVENALNGDRPINFGMRLKVFPKEHRAWNQLMAAHGLDSDDDGFVDITEGQLVHGHLHGESSMAFTRGGAGAGVPDEVHFVGLYSPDQGRLRIVGIIDIASNFQLDADGGSSCSSTSTALCYKNIFGRNIRRRIEFIGPFVPASGRFHGIYRETISGLVPGDGLTLEGGFILDQQSSDDSPLEVDGPIGATSIPSFVFPSVTIPKSTLYDTVAGTTCTSASDCDQTDHTYTCTDGECVLLGTADFPCGPYVSNATTKQAIDTFVTYISQAKHITASNVGEATACNEDGTCPGTQLCVKGTCQSGGVIFPNIVDWIEFIQTALDSLQPGSPQTDANPQDGFETTPSDPLDLEATDGEVVQAHLNIYNYLEEWVTPSAPGSTAPGTVDLAKLRCGLAIYQKAILGGGAAEPAAVSLSSVATQHPQGTEPDLFCYDTLPTEGCPSVALSYPNLFALQDHNRFWRNIAQALKFQGDRAQSDAFMTLFRNEVNPFAEGAAFSYKYDQLKSAIASYDQVLDITVNDTAASVLFQWPARSFKGNGKPWLDILHAVATDRMDALLELVDLERRVFVTATEDDFRYAHHLMQQEYLIQAYLMSLQSTWQGELFDYRGEAGPIFEQAQAIVNRLNPVKNELGITGNQVFFENANPEVNNWLNYRSLLMGGYGDGNDGLLAWAEDEVTSAVAEIQAAILDGDTFQDVINNARIAYADELASICGSSAPWVYAYSASANGGTAPPYWTGPTGGTATSFIDTTFTDDEARDICQKYLEGFDKVDDWMTLRDCALGIGADDGEADQNDALGNNTSTYVGWTSSYDSEHRPQCPTGATYNCSNACSSDSDDCDDSYVNYCDTLITTFKQHTTNMEVNISDVDPPTFQGVGAEGDVYGAVPDIGPTDAISVPPRCGYEGFQTHMLSIPVHGVQRPCVGGEMGAAFAEFERIQRVRRTSLNSVKNIIKRMRSKMWLIDQKWDSYGAKSAIRVTLTFLQDAMKLVAEINEMVILQTINELSETPKCGFIAGFSIGTDCIGQVAGSVVKGTSRTVMSTLTVLFHGISYFAGTLRDGLLALYEHTDGIDEIEADLMDMAVEIDAVVNELNVGNQEAFNAYRTIHDLRARAIRAGDRYGEDIYWLSTTLVGRESAHILRGEALARDASAAFHEILTIAYKMTMAFVHHYNAPPGDSTNLVSQVKSLTTLDDVRDFIKVLDTRMIEYCGLEGIDCDYENNTEIARLSLRDRLFPGLTDIIDARTGEVLTAGEQFHNTITAPPYMKRRFRGPYVVDQIELPLPLPLTALENGKNGPEWMLDPLACNQKIAGETTHAVKAIGRNLMEPGEYLNYELLRGPTDYIRACNIESMQKEIGTLPVLGYPTRTWTVGYAPQNPNALQEVPPAYTVRSNSFSMCMGEDETGALQKGWEGGTEESNANSGGCWKTFGRDRSLASLDQKLIIPVWVDDAATGNHWILGEGLKDDERPVIEDIIVNFRFTSRPVNE